MTDPRFIRPLKACRRLRAYNLRCPLGLTLELSNAIDALDSFDDLRSKPPLPDDPGCDITMGNCHEF